MNGSPLALPPQTSNVTWLFTQQQTGISLGLETMTTLLGLLGNPERTCPVFHIAGTNGKGSVAAFASSLLKAAKVRTGLYTSPHLVDFRERIVLDGEMIPLDDLEKGIQKLQSITQAWSIRPTFFELTTALAFDYFALHQCDVIILETGLGGRLDATNVETDKIACAITPISLDHQEWLGPTLADIACEKAGIIRPNVPLFTSPQRQEVMSVLQREANRLGAPVTMIKEPLSCHLPLGLIGSYQYWNAALALKLVESGPWKFSQENIEEGLRSVSWPGRFQRMRVLPSSHSPLPVISSPQSSKRAGTRKSTQTSVVMPGSMDVEMNGCEVILDGAHNPAAIKQLVATWKEQFANEQCILIFGALADKEWHKMLSLLELISSKIILVPVSSSRSIPTTHIATHFPDASAFSSLKEAFTSLFHEHDQKKAALDLHVDLGSISSPSHTSIHSSPFSYQAWEVSCEHQHEISGLIKKSEKNLLLRARCHAPILLTGSLFLVGEALSLLQGKVYHSSAQ